jgi:cobalt-zinc-cadmium efflux system outer membrane protein
VKRLAAPVLIVGLVQLFLPLKAQGQGPGQSDSLLARLTSEAIAASPAVLAQHATLRAATSRIRPAGALPDPMVEVGVMDLTLPGFRFYESDFTEIDFAISQEIPWPGTLRARTRGATALALEASSEFANLRRETTTRVAGLYYRLRFLRTARTILDHQLTLVESSVSIATSRYATGNATQNEPLQARVARARLETEVAELVAGEASIRAALRAMRHIRGPDPILVETIEPEAVLAMVSQDSAHLAMGTDSAVPLSHPRLAARRAAIEAAASAVRLEQLGARPDFTFTTRYGATTIGPDFFSAFVGVRVPLWAGRKQHRLAEAARAEEAAAQASLDEVAASLQSELETAYAEARAGIIRLDLLVTRVLPSSEAAAEAALRAYRLGQVDYLNVLMVQDALYRARLDAAEAAAEHLTHLAMLRQIITPENME